MPAWAPAVGSAARATAGAVGAPATAEALGSAVLYDDYRRCLAALEEVISGPLQQKKAARKERQQQRKREKRSGKRAAKAASLDQSQIDARKAKFAAKKARRLERKAAAS